MVEQSKIEWTDFTVNFWEGCQNVGLGCDNCYAEARDIRFTRGSHWGVGAPRRKVIGGIKKLQKINRDVEKFHGKHGRWPRVFCSSLSDLFDNAVDPAWRMEAFAAITVAPNTRPQLLTKRIGNVEKMIPATWRDGDWPHWVGLMITVVNQEEADRDIPKLLALKARLGIPWVGLSMEPLLGSVDLSDRCNGWYFENYLSGNRWHDGPISKTDRTRAGLDWVVCGGESGPNARPMHPDWPRDLHKQCKAAKTPFFFKQWGEWFPEDDMQEDVARKTYDADFKAGRTWRFTGAPMRKVGKKVAGRMLDGVEFSEFPKTSFGEPV